MKTSLTLNQKVCFLALIGLVLLIRVAYLDPDMTAQDSWRQTDTATIAENFLEQPNIFRPRINWGAPGPGYVESEFQLYTYAVHLLYRIFGVNPIIGRLLSIVLIGIASLIILRLAGRCLPPWQAHLAAVLFLWIPLVFRYSRNFMPESMVLVFYLLALDAYLAFLENDRWRSLLGSGAWMALAILVKPTSIHLGLGLILLTLARGGPGLLFSRKPAVFLFVALIPPACYYLYAANLHLRYGNTFGVISGGDSKWGDVSWWTNPEFYRHLYRTEKDWILGGRAGLVALAVGLWNSRRGKLPQLVLALAIPLLLYYLITARYAGSGRGLHYHIYAAVPACLVMAASLSGPWWGRRERLLARVGAGAAAVILVVVATGQAGINRQTLRGASAADARFKEAGIALGDVSEPGDYAVVVSADVSVDAATGVPNNFEQPNVFYFAKRRGRALARDRLNLKDLRGTLAIGAKWFVDFPEISGETATQEFKEYVGRTMILVRDGQGYRVYRTGTPQASRAISVPCQGETRSATTENRPTS